MIEFASFLRHFQRNLRHNLRNMASPSPARTPLSAQEGSLHHAPAASDLAKEAHKQLCTVKSLDIKVSSSDAVKTVSAYLHVPQNYRREQSEGREKTAAILLSGAGGGLVGPSSIYLSIADKLASLNRGIPILRLDYRYPACNKYCVPDVVAAMDYLQNGYAVSRFVLVGWSYGGAPVFSVGGQDDRVVGCATIASQTAETEGIDDIARKGAPVLLLHGTGDRTLSPSCSQSLYDRYGSRGGSREIELFEGDDHALTKNALHVEQLLCGFIMKQAGEDIGQQEQQDVVQRPLASQEQRIKKMKEGRDLRDESLE